MNDERARRRPVWHWVVCILYILIGFLGVLSFFVIISGVAEMDRKKQAYLASLSPLRTAGTAGASALYVVAGALLLLLKRAGLVLFAAAFALRLADHLVTYGVAGFVPDFGDSAPAKLIGRTLGALLSWIGPLVLIRVWSRWWRSRQLT